MNRIQLQQKKELFNSIVFKDQHSFFELSSFVRNLIELIREGDNAYQRAYCRDLELHVEHLGKPNIKSKRYFQSMKKAISKDLDSMGFGAGD